MDNESRWSKTAPVAYAVLPSINIGKSASVCHTLACGLNILEEARSNLVGTSQIWTMKIKYHSLWSNLSFQLSTSHNLVAILADLSPMQYITAGTWTTWVAKIVLRRSKLKLTGADRLNWSIDPLMKYQLPRETTTVGHGKSLPPGDHAWPTETSCDLNGFEILFGHSSNWWFSWGSTLI